jgi:DNA-binding FadR family transcriptional regulator
VTAPTLSAPPAANPTADAALRLMAMHQRWVRMLGDEVTPDPALLPHRQRVVDAIRAGDWQRAESAAAELVAAQSAIRLAPPLSE